MGHVRPIQCYRLTNLAVSPDRVMEKISRAFAATRVRVMLFILSGERLRRKALKARDNQKFRLARRLRLR
jgi:hypothetical protein